MDPTTSTEAPAHATTGSIPTNNDAPNPQKPPQDAAVAPPPPAQAPTSVRPTQPAQPAQPTQRRQVPVTRDRYIQQSLGTSLNSLVKKARVLMVGAGGIGCELLKNLALNGFGEIHVVDLDTIDLSNLNRQFLFRYEHIKKSKALVAKDAAQRFNPNVKIVAHHANIKEPNFSVSWFRGFTLVLNALDNFEARRHVNKMCLAADVPLIESGTTGFNGQVQVIKKGVTTCYDCEEKPTTKTFPVCTIRSTPSQPIHCIVWAKSYLLNEVFGVSEDQAAFDHSGDADNAQEIGELKKESEALKQIRDATGKPEFPKLLFEKVFNTDVVRLRSVEDMWKSRKAPEPVEYDTLMGKSSSLTEQSDAIIRDGQKVWSLEESLIVFNDSLDRLSKRILQMRKDKDPSAAEPTIAFDKDDEDTLDFVVSSANIRSSVFGIDRKSRFETKQMAGNIIPAIATTNAIVAGVCILQAYKVLRGDIMQAKEVFLQPFSASRLLAPDKKIRGPKPDCPVCGVYYTSVAVDMSRATLKDIVDGLIRKDLAFGDKEFALSNEVGILYDPDETENLSKKLSDLGVGAGSFLTVMDEDDQPWVNVMINIEEESLEAEAAPYKSPLTEPPQIPQKPMKPEPETNGSAANGNGVQNGAHSEAAGSAVKGTKRLRSVEVEEQEPAKKARMAGSSVDDAVVVEEGEGLILIED